MEHKDVSRLKGENGDNNSSDDIMELKNRAHLLTEENQALFQ